MKLLPKKEIDSRVNAEKKSIIDSGVFIAKKIDALREEMLELQNKRDAFISGSQQVINDSLSSLLERKDSIQKEIEDLEIQRKELLIPELEKEWLELTKGVSVYATEKDKFYSVKEKITKDEKEIAKIKEDISRTVERTRYKEEEVDKAWENIVYLEKAAKEKYQTIADEHILQTSEHEKDMSILKGMQEKYENGIDLYNRKEKDLLERESILTKERRHLESQQNQLRIALEVIKKK